MSIEKNGLDGLEDRLDSDGNKKWFRELLENKKSIYIMIAILSAIVFCSIYGVKVLNPTYTDWLLAGEDLSQHYLGWTAYRASSWHFPIGMVDTLAYPHQTSIIFTDSIPIFAVLFKILSPILPEKFQYFGLWGITCFALQGILAARIINNFVENRVAIIMASLLFLFTTIMIARMFTHTALAGQWVLLLGLEPIFAHWKYRSNRRIYFIVGLMGGLSVFIHIYFLLMNGIILLGICFTDVLVYRRIKRSGLILMEYLGIAAMVTWVLGGFSSAMSAQIGGLGKYSSNLNTFFSPMGWSRIYRDLLCYNEAQREGSGYLGGGCIVLLLLAIICLADEKTETLLKIHWKECIVIIGVSGASMMVALSPIITIDDQIILQMQLPQWLMDKWSIFRASGRIVWIVVYIIMLVSCIVIIRTVNKRMMVAALSILLAIQVYDISDVLKTINEKFDNNYKYVSMLREDDFWNYIAQNDDIRHIVFFSSVEQPMMYSITDWAIQNGKTVNNFYFARSINDKVSVSTANALNALSVDTLFIFNENESLNALQYNLHYYRIDGLIIGYRNKIPGFDKLVNSGDIAIRWNFGGNLFLSENGGVDTENGREIYSGGLSYGPYWYVPKGNYVITIAGEDMWKEGLDVSIYSQYGERYHDFEVLSRDATEIKLNIFLAEDIENLEISMKNNTESTVLIRSLEIRYVE